MLTIPDNLISAPSESMSMGAPKPSETNLLMAAAEMHRQGAFDVAAMDPTDRRTGGRVLGEGSGGGAAPYKTGVKAGYATDEDYMPLYKWGANENKVGGGRGMSQEESDAMVDRLIHFLKREELGIRPVPGGKK
jgi:hypothetical protein